MNIRISLRKSAAKINGFSPAALILEHYQKQQNIKSGFLSAFFVFLRAKIITLIFTLETFPALTVTSTQPNQTVFITF
jgi:hypothetical protein